MKASFICFQYLLLSSFCFLLSNSCIATNSPTTTISTTTTTVNPCAALGSTWIYNPANGYCYFVGSGIFISWFAAEADCVAMGAHLTSILNQAENDFIVMITSTGTGLVNILNLPWIGLQVNIIPTPPFFQPAWVDGSPYPGSFTNWIIPFSGTVPLCAQLLSNLPLTGPPLNVVGTWYPTPCLNIIGKYVCKRLP